MLIIGCDFHARYQQIAKRDQSTIEPLRYRAALFPVTFRSTSVSIY